MAIDGERAALDVTMFTTIGASTAGAYGATLRKAIETRLKALDGHRSVLGLVVYDRAGLLALTKPQRLDATEAIAAAFAAEAESTMGEADRLRIDVRVPWVRGASVSLTTDPRERRRVSVHVLAPRGDVAEQVDTFIRERIAKKRSQMAPWGRAILVVVHGCEETADDVAAGFARLGRCPWWRVYWAGPSPDDVHLVASDEI